MTELWPGARVLVRVPEPPRVVVETTSIGLAAEIERATEAESALSTALGLETTARQNADTLEATTRGNADTALDGRVTPIESALAGRLSDATLSATYAAKATAGKACATDGSFSLAAPTGVGLEFVITGNALQDIRFNGTSL